MTSTPLLPGELMLAGTAYSQRPALLLVAALKSSLRSLVGLSIMRFGSESPSCSQSAAEDEQ